MGTLAQKDPERVNAGFLAACLSSREAIVESTEWLRPGSTYLLCFGKHFSRLVVRAHVRYCHLVPVSPRRFEIGLLFPLSVDGERLEALNRSSIEPLPLHGHPRLVEDSAGIAFPVRGAEMSLPTD